MKKGPTLLLGLILAAATAVSTFAGELQSLQRPMTEARVITLQYVPGVVLFRPNKRVFLVASDSHYNHGTATVSAYNADDASKLFQFDVPHTVAAMTFSGTGNWLFLVGARDGEGFATRVKLAPTNVAPDHLATVKLEGPSVWPSISVDGRLTLYVSDATSYRIMTIPSTAFEQPITSEHDVTRGDFVLYAVRRGGIHVFTISEAINVAFVSSETVPRIAAFRLGGIGRANEVIDEFARPSSKASVYGEARPPLALLLTSGIKTPQTNQVTGSLLIGDHASSSLTVVDFDPDFGTMDIVATVPVGIRINPKSALQADPVTNLVKQPFIIGSDDKQNAILVGNAYSTQLVQFSRHESNGGEKGGTTGAALERIGELEINGPPTSIAVSGDGEVAVVAVANSPELSIFSSGPVLIPGDAGAKIRLLQRLLSEIGLDVGSIDGVPGQATVHAINVFNLYTSNSVNLNNTDEALSVLTTFISNCSTSGLRCLVDNSVSKRPTENGPGSQNTAAPTTTIYRLCTGEYERACQTHDAYLYCYGDVGSWAKARCNSYQITRVNTYGGNKCGYSIDSVMCVGPK
jgi:hypothetical protein